ncbi:MAG: ATP synthase F1 subunit gamma [Dehalococcoidia bacterium]|nr:ATP synthase F1 subunit gamma [Dehalococcoidia bacterium]
MASIQVLRRRIRSIQGTQKICRAMEMIATSKMRRTQDKAIEGRPYSEKISQVIADLAARPQAGEDLTPLLQKREAGRIGIVYFTTDRGLCGGLNANLNRMMARFILEQSVPISVVTVGRKGRAFMLRSGQNIRAEFSGISDRPTLLETLPISRVVIEDYVKGEVDVVYMVYPRFVTTMEQCPSMDILLPVEVAQASSSSSVEYIYEPGPAAVLNELLPRYVEMKIYHTMLELIASEQSARMVAMRNASDNAQDVTEDLTLMLNKVRQEIITKEICDISGGAEALAGT